MKVFKNWLVFAVAGLAFASCDQFKTSQTESGLRYKFFKEAKDGKKAKEGQFIEFHMIVTTATDSVLGNTFEDGMTYKTPVMKPRYKGSIEEGFTLMSKGDSAIFYIPVDSIAKGMQELPAGLKRGTDLKYTVKLVNIMTSQQEFETAVAKGNEEYRTKTMKRQQDATNAYIAKNMPKAIKTANGIAYVVNEPGAGATVSAGDSVFVDYTGKLLNGKVFDSSKGAQPIGLALLETPLIQGWNETLITMKKGESRTVVIPYTLGYGEQGSGGAIGPFETLVFDMKLVDVKPKKRK